MSLLLFLIIGFFFLMWCSSKLHFPWGKQLVVLFLIIIMGLRYNVGRDYPAYELIYDEPYSDAAMGIEPIWKWINSLLHFIGFQSRGFFFLTSSIIAIGYCRGIKKLSNHFYLSALLFILCGFYYESANMVRQYVAMALLFCGFLDFVNKKYWKYILWIIVAAMFHFSVFVVIPIIFLTHYRYSFWLLLSALLVSFFYGDMLLNILISTIMPSLQDIGSYQYDIDYFDAGIGSGALKIFYNIIALLVLFLYLKYGKNISSFFCILMNMVLIGVIIYNVCYLFMPARRLYLYFFSYIIILFPYCLHWLKRESQFIAFGTICVFFLIFLLKSYCGIPYDFDFSFF